MKASKSTVQMMADKMRTYLAARYPAILKQSNFTYHELLVIWYHVCDEHKHADDHPRFKDRKRVFAHDWNFPIYPDDTNDETLKTALIAAGKLILSK